MGAMKCAAHNVRYCPECDVLREPETAARSSHEMWTSGRLPPTASVERKDARGTDDAGVSCSSDDLDRLKTQGWLEGQVVGLEAAAAYVRERAVALFRAGEDEDAKEMRDLADMMVSALRPKMENAAEDHDKEFPSVIRRA